MQEASVCRQLTKEAIMITKTVLASEHAFLDSDVYTGGGTDDTAALQSLLDKAAAWGGLRLIMDGAALVSGLRVHSNTTIECLNKDCGFFLKSGSFKAIVENYDRDYEVIKNRNITLTGGTYNVNNQGQERSVPGIDAAITQRIRDVHGITDENSRVAAIAMVFTGVENLLIRDVTLRDQRGWAFHTSNFKQVLMENIIIDLPGKTDNSNQDGLHFYGPGQFLTLRNIIGDAGDDFIALTPDEHDKVSSITDVLIDGVFLNHADQGIRLLSRGTGALDRITIRNVTGTYRSYGFYVNPWYSDDTCGNYGSILFENIDLRPEAANYTYRPPILFQIGGHIEHLTLRDIKDHYTKSQRTLVEIGDLDRSADSARTLIEKLTVDGFSILREDAISISPFLVDAEIKRMDLRNVDISCGNTENISLIDFGKDGHIGTLAVNGLISDGLKNFADIPDGAVDKKIIWNVEPADFIDG